MTEVYRVPKRELTAEVTVVGRPAVAVTLFLSEQARSHEGYERPSDMLNGIDSFFPTLLSDGQLLLFQRDAVSVVSVPAESEEDVEGVLAGSDGPGAPTIRQVEVVLEGGGALRGSVEYVMPEDRRRLQDFLNAGDRFLSVRQGDTVHLINKLRIVSIVAC